MKLHGLRLLLAGTAIGAAAAATLSPASADSRGEWSGKSGHRAMGVDFAELDADGDGQLSEEEFAAAKMVWLASRDSDGDGMLSQEELEAAILEHMKAIASRSSGAMIERLDDNDDGMISVDELGGRYDPSEVFSRLDEDEDGMISESEFERMMSRDGKRRGHGKWGQGNRKGWRDHDRK